MPATHRIRLAGLAFWAAALLLAAGPPAVQAAPEPQPWSGKVTSVVDGATLEIMRPYGPERLHLAGVESPDLGQPWGRQAKDFSTENALGQVVTVEPQGYDHRKRLLADIILPDGRDLGAEMVKEGLAWTYRRYATNPLLGDLEKDARAENRGLWSDPRPVPPWEWRARGGETSTPEPSPQKSRKSKKHKRSRSSGD